jgi:hypothetical protein
LAERPRTDFPFEPWEWVLVFDTETTADSAQRLRIGTFQLRQAGALRQKGIFFDPDAVTQSEWEVLIREAPRHKCVLLTVREFIEEKILHDVYGIRVAGGTIVGFNLPFDLSRLALKHASARAVTRQDARGNRVTDRSMVGAFTFALSPLSSRPRLRVQHISRRFSFMNFTTPRKQSTGRSRRKKGKRVPHERGYFLDLRTLAAALTSTSHTLDSLARFLGVSRKRKFTDFSRPIDPEFVDYAVHDTEVTWQCYVKLMARYERHGLSDTPAHRVYTEASLGKAYLQAMGIRPWRQVQPDFDPAVIGAIMSSYFGGRSEVHRRREIVRTIYCDFASMYPTVCTLMGLWQFVIANGMDTEDATERTQLFLDTIDVSTLGDPFVWRDLTVLVQLQADADIFPVRARYGQEPTATIGVNYLSADRPLWFTLADCVASKILTGKAPRITQAIRFAPRSRQNGLCQIKIAGNDAYPINPEKDDFYRRVIDLRREVQDQFTEADRTGDSETAARLDAEQLALKILANATSYGIFVELNVDDPGDQEEVVTIQGASGAYPFSVNKREKPGSFFHPLLGTLITGAARLMLAITERLLTERGLDWAFCDTDSMAFAMPEGMAVGDFEQRARDICDWFEPLNPYSKKGSILRLEKQNFAEGSSDRQKIQPLYCFAVSAKRYVLFNVDANGRPIVRKASAHGLGHLIAPYGDDAPGGDDDPDEPERDTGVRLWQEDVWNAIVAAAMTDRPRDVSFSRNGSFAKPAASRYAASTPETLGWMKAYNKDLPYPQQVRPFNFLLWFHAKKPEDLQAASDDRLWDPRERRPKPVGPYSRDPSSVLDKVVDRETGEPVAQEWLRSYADVLRAYHVHAEAKFLGGRPGDSGPLSRRHVFVSAVENIGKEADSWEEDELLGSDADSVVSYGLSQADRDRMIATIRQVHKRKLKAGAKVGFATIERVLASDTSAPDRMVRKLFDAAVDIQREEQIEVQREHDCVIWLRDQAETIGVERLAGTLEYDVANLRKVIAGVRKPSAALLKAIDPVRNLW